MINSTKIQEWIRQIEDYPLIAPFIIRRISDRLLDLDSENENLRSENLALRDGQKIKEYEQRIADLEYQVELLKRRQSSGESAETIRLRILAYRPDGKLLSLPFDDPRQHMPILTEMGMEVSLLCTRDDDEILFLFTTGRIETLPVRDIFLCDLNSADPWQTSYQVGLRGREELASIAVITAAPMLAACVQTSRKGYARCVTSDYFQLFLAKHSIGSGVKARLDQPFNLILCNPEDLLVLFSREGNWFSVPVNCLSSAVEEEIKLSLEDYLIGAIRIKPEDAGKSIVAVSTTGSVAQIPADVASLSKNTLKRGRKVFPGKAEVLCGAALAGENDRVLLLSQEGVFQSPITPGELATTEIPASGISALVITPIVGAGSPAHTVPSKEE